MNLRFTAALFTAAALLLTACNGSTSTAPPAPPNVSGDYTGSVQDAQMGSGNVTGTLAQHGNSAGGAMTMPVSGGTLNFQMSLALSPNNSMSGSIVVNLPNNGPACTFSTTATYDPTNNVISGTYTAVSNCAGDTGSYTLNQQCVDTATSVGRRTMGLHKC
ncbi:MAG TPA: hypothetical protein VGZ02_14945 [Candidatus Baltobacteraceae bacterium]|jgi:hypothetical protein|nr:hypothetical protein [Candidatus Baltobacteraceae bacterium]